MPNWTIVLGTAGDVVGRAKVVFIADTLDNARLFQEVLSELGVETSAGSTQQIDKLLRNRSGQNLVIFESRGSARASFVNVKSLVEELKCSLLLIVDESDIAFTDMRMPVRCDFVVNGATRSECLTRVRFLLGVEPAEAEPNIISVGPMDVNLDTYKITVAGEPVDFTYLEYALLAFMVQHPNRAFSRKALLQRVWGTDYAGGLRTVDVHVRRIRSKLGPSLAQHLETIRNVGYLWTFD